MNKSTKKSLAKIAPAEYKQSVIKALESQLSQANNEIKGRDEQVSHLRSVVNTLTANTKVLMEKNNQLMRAPPKVIHQVVYLPESARKRWYQFWRQA